VVPICGWALGPELPTHVDILVDGRPVGRARVMARPRPDVEARFDAATAPLAGFEDVVDLTGYAPGTKVELGARVIGISGVQMVIPPVTVEIGLPAPRSPDDARLAELHHRTETTIRAVPEPLTRGDIRLFVCTNDLGIGGGQLYLQELLRNLPRELWASMFVAAQAGGPLAEELERLGARVHVIGPTSVYDYERYEAQVLELAVLARLQGCNVGIVNSMAAHIGADVACRLEIPAVWAIHESFTLDEYWLAANSGVAPIPAVIEQAHSSLREVAAVVFEANATQALYAAHGDARRFITVPYGIVIAAIDQYLEQHDRSAVRRKINVPDDTVVMLCVGTFEARKAQGLLAAAFAQVADEFPDAMLVFVGDRDNEYSRGVRQTLARLDLGGRIRVVAVTPDVFDWYLAADVLVSASDVESMPRSMLEAMAFGRPIVAAAAHGVVELVTDGVEGLLFEPRDVSAAAQTLRKFLRYAPEVRNEFGRAGATRVRAQYDAVGYVEAFRMLLTGLVAQPTAFPSELIG
jgi:glycosyltransferase involved in cell wall biosynthesis